MNGIYLFEIIKIIGYCATRDRLRIFNMDSIPAFSPTVFSIFVSWVLSSQSSATTLYDFGDPSGEEQANIEMINRARANPPAEGVRLANETDVATVDSYGYFGTDLNLMKSELNAIAASAPLAPNQLLTQSARNHSQWMLTNAVQQHDENPGVAGGDFFERIQAAGFNYTQVAENIFSYVESVPHAHASFEVDWGWDAGGMQDGRGHRVNLHNPNYREIGAGFLHGTNGDVGPRLVTQELGLRAESPVFVTGVAYYDINGNNFYDEGEGLPGLTVTGSHSTYHCFTAEGGGWVLPLSRPAGSQTVNWQCADLNVTSNFTVAASLANVKVDLKLAYAAPQFTGGSKATAGVPFQMPFTGVPAVTSYLTEWWSAAAAAAENAENTNRIVAAISPGYNLLSSTVKKQGAYSFHMAHPIPEDQIVELNQNYFGTASSMLNFQSRLRQATSDQSARVEILLHGGEIWQTLWSQGGTNGTGETAFNARSVNLAFLDGKIFRIRFRYAIASGTYYPNTSDSNGWFVDAITLPNVFAIDNYQTISTDTTSVTIPANSYPSFVVKLSPFVGAHFLPGPTKMITVAAATGFTAWALARENSSGLPVGSIAAQPSLDYDSDGASNLLEYAYGLNPSSALDGSLVLPKILSDGLNFILEYKADTSKSDLNFRPETKAGNSSNWVAPGDLAGFTDTLVASNGTVQTRRASLPMGSFQRAFFRLAVELK